MDMAFIISIKSIEFDPIDSVNAMLAKMKAQVDGNNLLENA